MGPLGNNHSDQISPYLPDFESDDESPPILVSAKEDYEKNDPHPIMMAESIKKIEPEKRKTPLSLGCHQLFYKKAMTPIYLMMHFLFMKQKKRLERLVWMRKIKLL